MPYLTPDSIPEESDCRSLFIPASSDWLAIVSGALTELEKKWNWEQKGSVTVDQATEAMRIMITNYYAGCAACTQPGGYRVIRIGTGGHVEELGGDGEYVSSTGDYAVPPIPAREGGTEEDQICLAAENAENVLHEVYDNLADSFASSLSEAEALTALAEFLIVTLGAEFAPITYGLALLILTVFGLVYAALSYLTADLWDSNFTKAFKCMLVACANNDAGVVTFDFDCIEHALYSASTSFGIDETQLRLYGQIAYILAFTGGADMLNTAGATTGITEADCSECSADHCWHWDSPTPTSQFVSGGYAFTEFALGNDVPFTIKSITIGYSFVFVPGDQFLLEAYDDGTLVTFEDIFPSTSGVETIYNDPTGRIYTIPVITLADHNDYPVITSIEIHYVGEVIFPQGFSCDP